MQMLDRLGGLALFCHREARRCFRGRADLSASIMHVMALEAALRAMCYLFAEQIRRTSTFKKKRFRGKRNKPLELTLDELVRIAEELDWLPKTRFAWCGEHVSIAGIAKDIRKAENLAKPNKAACEEPRSSLYAGGTYEVVCEIFDEVLVWLLGQMTDGLEQRMQKEITRLVELPRPAGAQKG
jgi:hypothetical protein